MATKGHNPVVHIVLETSCLFTEAADKLIRDDLSEFILATRSISGVHVNWYLPQIVRAERKHQMVQRACKLMPQVEKVERLLGHKLNITHDILAARVEEVIQREVARHGLSEPSLDVTRVQWEELISCAVERRPPFDPGEKEKGFRDAIVLETFCQAIEQLPLSSARCRIVLMCGDRLLIDAARRRTSDRSYVMLSDDLDTLRTMLNALSSQLDQQVIDEILPHATALFFSPEAKTTLYYTADLNAQILSTYGNELKTAPTDDWSSVRTTTIYIHNPSFLKKSGQRLQFRSRIEYQMEAVKSVSRQQRADTASIGNTLQVSPPPAGGLLGSLSMGLNPFLDQKSTEIPGLLEASRISNPGDRGYLPPFPPSLLGDIELIRRHGRHMFEVTWSATLTSHGKVKTAKLEGIEYKGSTWDEQLV